jgi:hypothetical protein
MADFTLQALNDEIDNDPLAIGYKVGAVWKGDAVIAALINAPNYTIDRNGVPAADIRATTTYAAYDTLSIDEQEWTRWMSAGDGEVTVTADMKLQLSGRIPATNGVGGTGTNASSFWAAAHRDVMAPAMLALIEVPGSRAEVLWGEYVTVSLSDVGQAANL